MKPTAEGLSIWTVPSSVLCLGFSQLALVFVQRLAVHGAGRRNPATTKAQSAKAAQRKLFSSFLSGPLPWPQKGRT
jgi:hypothetical protein